LVLFTGSFSKVLFPSLSLGYMVVPPDLVDYFSATPSRQEVRLVKFSARACFLACPSLFLGRQTFLPNGATKESRFKGERASISQTGVVERLMTQTTNKMARPSEQSGPTLSA
jgi:hypothetical protein